MILTDEMFEAAFRFRSICLWEKLTDSDVFAFRLSDGETGYCSVMGNAGEHFSLGFNLFEDFENGQPANFWLRDV